MLVASAITTGTDRVVALGIAHSIAMTAGAACLFVLVRRRVGFPLPFTATTLRTVVVSAAGGAVAALVVEATDSAGRAGAAVALVAGSVAAGIVVLGGQLLLGAPELRNLTAPTAGFVGVSRERGARAARTSGGDHSRLPVGDDDRRHHRSPPRPACCRRRGRGGRRIR